MDVFKASRGLLLALALLVVLGGCEGSTVTVSGPGPDGKLDVSSQGGQFPPVDAKVGEKGIEQAPTATPGQPTPIYPVETPAPAPTRPPG